MDAELNPGLTIPAQYLAACKAFFERALQGTTFRSWIALDGEIAVAALTLHLFDTLPRVGAVRALDGRIRSVYTDPAYRRRGVVAKLLGEAIEEAEREHVDRLTLAASEMGLPAYEKLGFIRTLSVREMIYRGNPSLHGSW